MEFQINSFNGFIQIKLSLKEIYLKMMQLYECSEIEEFVNALMVCIHRKGSNPEAARVVATLKTLYDAYRDNLIEPPFNPEEAYQKVVYFLKQKKIKENKLAGKT